MKNKHIYFSYPNCIAYSGQTEASKLILDVFKDKTSFVFVKHVFPALNRKKKFSLLSYIFSLIIYYLSFISFFFKKKDIIYINLAQTLSKFIMHALPTLLFFSNSKLVISLHGNSFLHWNEGGLKQRLFVFMLKRAKVVTILGNKQRIKLASWGVKNTKLVPNYVRIPTTKPQEIISKHKLPQVHLLHLGLLIESKGFPVVLETLVNLKKRLPNIPITFTLCGPISFTKYCKKFTSIDQKKEWIEDRIKEINKHIPAKWIPGVKGIKKHELFNEATMFIFPSNFPVESQPLVLLEAAATGATIVTSKAGEISDVFTDKEVMFLDEACVKEVENKILKLIENRELRVSLALKALEKFKKTHSRENYKKNWIEIFETITE